MLERLQKFGRKLWRDRFPVLGVAIAMIPVTAAIVGSAAVSVTLGAAGFIASGVIAAGFAAVLIKSERAERDVDLGFRKQNGIACFQHLRGPQAKVAVLMNTQKLLWRKLHKYERAGALPQDVLINFAPYLRDAEEAGRHVKAVLPGTDVELPAFDLFRKFVDASGQKREEKVAEIPLLHKLQPWEIEKQRREAAERHRQMVEREVEAIHAGAGQVVAMRTLKFKPKSGLSR